MIDEHRSTLHELLLFILNLPAKTGNGVRIQSPNRLLTESIIKFF
jgi:hypothetical protein